MTAVLQSYRDKLTERTANHMGYPYNLVNLNLSAAPFFRSLDVGPSSGSHDRRKTATCLVLP